MTREQAINELTQLLHEDFLSEYAEAIRMAIKALELESESRMKYVKEAVYAILNTCDTDSIADNAMRNAAKFVQNAIDGSYPDFEKLEQEPCEDCISREEALRALMDEWTEYDRELIDWLFEKVDKLPSVSPQPCEDAISRQKLLKAIATLDKFGCDADNKLVRYTDHFVPYVSYYDVIDCIELAWPVTPQQEPCEDCISRQAVLDLVADYDLSMGQVVKGIHALPSVTPQPKMGRWIYKKEEDTYRCSLCSFPCHKDNMGAIPTKYCAECGAIMQEVEE